MLTLIVSGLLTLMWCNILNVGYIENVPIRIGVIILILLVCWIALAIFTGGV